MHCRVSEWKVIALASLLLNCSASEQAEDIGPESTEGPRHALSRGGGGQLLSSLTEASEPECFDEPKGIFRHRLLGAVATEVGIPGIDYFDSPTGHRYAIVREVAAPLEGVEEVVRSGVVELPLSASNTNGALGNTEKALPSTVAPVPKERGSPIRRQLRDVLAASRREPNTTHRVTIDFRVPPSETLQKRLERLSHPLTVSPA